MCIIAKFMRLEPEKRERILNAAIDEFASKGYKNASTNEIVQEAGISKGLLFHYFANKRALYFFLYDYLLDILTGEYLQKLQLEETDLLEKMRKASLAKLELFRRHPQIFKFFLTAYTETDLEVRDELAVCNHKILEINMPKIFANIEMPNLRDGVDSQRAFKLMIWALEGYSNSKVSAFKTMDEQGFSDMVAELSIYLDILRKCFFKNENEEAQS